MGLTGVQGGNSAGPGDVATILDGSSLNHPVAILEFLPTSSSTSPTLVTPVGTELPITSNTRMVIVAASSFTRPANTTAYTANEAVSNSTTASSVTAVSFTAVDINNAPIDLRRCRIATTDTGAGSANAAFRIYFYQSNPTSSSGVVGGDGAAFSTKQGTFVGSMTGTMLIFSDGGVAVCTPEAGSEIITLPTSGAETLYALLQTTSGFTPISASTWTLTIEGFQGRS